jgi:preprotein translocase subunit SecD
MNWKTLKTPFKALVIVAVVALSIWSILPVTQKIHLGLDLQGGSRLLLQLYPTAEVPRITTQVQAQTREVIDRRINGLGVAEPSISNVGTDRILVELPNVKNPDEAENVLKQVAVLEYKIVPPDVAQKAESALAIVNNPSASVPAKAKAAAEAYVAHGAYDASGPVVYSGKDLKAAQAGFDQSSQPNVLFQTKNPAKFGKLTQANVGKPLGIFLDHRYVSAPIINSPIYDNGEITGSFSQEQTMTLANELNAGALPVTVKIIEKETIGPTLGKIDLVQSLRASILGLGLVLLFMLFVYRLPGFLADVALAIYVLVMMAILAISHATLTLPGIAGFVLSIGMAVDANVLIFERIKEELWNGKTMRAAVRVGFQRAFSAVFDSHFTTIVGAGVLYMLGTGTVKGFAFTLFWGTVVSLITAVFVTRFFVDALVDNDIATTPELYGIKRSEVGIFSKGATALVPGRQPSAKPPGPPATAGA